MQGFESYFVHVNCLLKQVTKGELYLRFANADILIKICIVLILSTYVNCKFNQGKQGKHQACFCNTHLRLRNPCHQCMSYYYLNFCSCTNIQLKDGKAYQISKACISRINLTMLLYDHCVKIMLREIIYLSCEVIVAVFLVYLIRSFSRDKAISGQNYVLLACARQVSPSWILE